MDAMEHDEMDGGMIKPCGIMTEERSAA